MHDGTYHWGDDSDLLGEETQDTNPGFMTLQDLLPEGLLDAYDLGDFQDYFGAQFDTSLLDITKQAGQENIFNTMAQGQTAYMQVPGQVATAGASGFQAADSSRGLITAQGAQRGMFADVTEASLGAKKADITALESLKDRAFNMFSDIQMDLPKAGTGSESTGEGTTTTGTGPDGESTTWTFGSNGAPTEGAAFGTVVTNPVSGQVWIWYGGGWQEQTGLGDLIPPGTTAGDDDNLGTDVIPPQPPQPPPPGGGLGGCFLAGTMILTGDGTEIPIEKIKKGMEVYAYDEESAELKLSKVSKTFFHPKENTYLVINDNLLVTPNHPVLNNNKWVEIGELGEGDMLTDKDNNPIPISKIKEVKELSDVFNFEVEKYHTYVAEGIIVHNKGIEDPGGGGGDAGGGDFGDDFFWPTGP